MGGKKGNGVKGKKEYVKAQKERTAEKKKEEAAVEEAKKRSGCNCPFGCKIGTPVTIGQNGLPVEGDAVLVECSNEKCPANPWIHQSCFTEWEDMLIQLLLHNQAGRSRNWTEVQCRTSVWLKKGFDLIWRHCECVGCRYSHHTSFLHKCDEVEVAKKTGLRPVRKVEKPKKKEAGPKYQPVIGKPIFNFNQNVPGWSGMENCRTYLPQEQVEGGGGVSVIRSLPVGMSGWKADRPPGRQRYNSGGGSSGNEWPALPSDIPNPSQPYYLSGESGEGDEWTRVVTRRRNNSGTTIFASHQEKTEFIEQLQGVVRVFGGSINAEDTYVKKLFSNMTSSLAMEISSFGGLDGWLREVTSTLNVYNGYIYLAGSSEGVEEIRRGMGTVTEVEGDGRRGLIHSHKHDCFLLFTPHTLLFSAPNHFLRTNDIVSFKAQRERGGGSWVAQKVTLFQRDPLEMGTASSDNEQVRSANALLHQLQPSENNTQGSSAGASFISAMRGEPDEVCGSVGSSYGTTNVDTYVPTSIPISPHHHAPVPSPVTQLRNNLCQQRNPDTFDETLHKYIQSSYNVNAQLPLLTRDIRDMFSPQYGRVSETVRVLKAEESVGLLPTDNSGSDHFGHVGLRSSTEINCNPEESKVAEELKVDVNGNGLQKTLMMMQGGGVEDQRSQLLKDMEYTANKTLQQTDMSSNEHVSLNPAPPLPSAHMEPYVSVSLEERRKRLNERLEQKTRETQKKYRDAYAARFPQT